MNPTCDKGKILRKCLLFLLIFILIFLPLNQVLVRKSLSLPWNMTTKVNGFYNEPENSFDLMIFGSSHAYCSVNPPLLFEQTGITSYLLCSQQQPLWATYHYMVEAFQTQRPKLAVVEVYMACESEEYMEEGTNYSASDDLKFSRNKMDLICALAPKGQRFQYLCNFVKYHSRWDQLGEQDFRLDYLEERDPLKGYVLLDKTISDAVFTDVSDVTAYAPLLDKNVDYLNRIIDLCEEKEVELFWIKSPSNETAELKEKVNSVEAIARQRGVPFADFNLDYDRIGLEVNQDFYDYGHLNYRGTEKFTSYFSNYLTRSYDLPDHRGEAAYADWREDIVQYRRMVAELS